MGGSLFPGMQTSVFSNEKGALFFSLRGSDDLLYSLIRREWNDRWWDPPDAKQYWVEGRGLGTQFLPDGVRRKLVWLFGIAPISENDGINFYDLVPPIPIRSRAEAIPQWCIPWRRRWTEETIPQWHRATQSAIEFLEAQRSGDRPLEKREWSRPPRLGEEAFVYAVKFWLGHVHWALLMKFNLKHSVPSWQVKWMTRPDQDPRDAIAMGASASQPVLALQNADLITIGDKERKQWFSEHGEPGELRAEDVLYRSFGRAPPFLWSQSKWLEAVRRGYADGPWESGLE